MQTMLRAVAYKRILVLNIVVKTVHFDKDLSKYVLIYIAVKITLFEIPHENSLRISVVILFMRYYRNYEDYFILQMNGIYLKSKTATCTFSALDVDDIKIQGKCSKIIQEMFEITENT